MSAVDSVCVSYGAPSRDPVRVRRACSAPVSPTWPRMTFVCLRKVALSRILVKRCQFCARPLALLLDWTRATVWLLPDDAHEAAQLRVRVPSPQGGL